MSRGESLESRVAFEPGDKTALREMVLRLVRQRGRHGATADEVVVESGLTHNSCGPRLTERGKQGRVVALIDHAGKPVRRRTAQGCMAGVFVAPEFAASATWSQPGPKQNQQHVSSAQICSNEGRIVPETQASFPELGRLAPERYGVD